MKQRLAIIEGYRTPFCKAGTAFKDMGAVSLGSSILRELMARTSLEHADIDEIIMGNVAQPAQSANAARVMALQAGFGVGTIAQTVHRNCASGMQSMSAAANKIRAGEIKIAVVGGAESMSQIPLLVGPQMSKLFVSLLGAKTIVQKLKILGTFRPSFLKPVSALQLGLFDSVCGLNMGQTAEVLCREFAISREQQDEYALQSHQRAVAAQCLLAEEIIPLARGPYYTGIQEHDNGPRPSQSKKDLEKLRPYFDRTAGSVTVGNACPISDGAVAFIVMSENEAKQRGLDPLGYLSDYAYAGLEGERMGLGPAYATARLLEKTTYEMNDFDVIELNEAFAAQVLANECAFASTSFAQKYLNRTKALGEIDRTILNVHGGAIALGHPVGATGARLILTLLHTLRRRGLQRGLATLCIGGGQGAAFSVEVE